MSVHDEEGIAPIVAVGILLVGAIGTAWWVDSDWTSALLREAGGEATAFVLRGAFSVIDLIAAQAALNPGEGQWWEPLRTGPAVPLWLLAAAVTVIALLAEVVRGLLTGNTSVIAQAVLRAVWAGVMATAGGALLLTVGEAFTGVGAAALEASGAAVDAPLVPLQDVLMDSATQHEAGAELFITFFCALVIVVTGLLIYLTLAMRPILLAVVIVWLPVAHALAVWKPMARATARTWGIGIAILLADAAILTVFAVVNTVGGQPEGIDRLLFGTGGMVLAALAPAALARVVGAPEAERAAQALRSGGGATLGMGAKALTVAGTAAVIGGRASQARKARSSSAL